jgi:prepilin-type N-terminal cleavage/methylation domain-containing protein
MFGSQRIRCVLARRGGRGFTLVELLTVVAIVGVLATIAVILVSRHVRAGKSVEAISIISSIRTAQEAYRAETGSYLNVTQTAEWYPKLPDGDTRLSFALPDGAHVDAPRWRQLGVSRTDGTRFGFRAYAGSAGPVNVTLSTTGLTFANARDFWYVIEASGDLTDSSPELSLYVASSHNNELYVENEGE